MCHSRGRNSAKESMAQATSAAIAASNVGAIMKRFSRSPQADPGTPLPSRVFIAGRIGNSIVVSY